jgi:hypothetical protein
VIILLILISALNLFVTGWIFFSLGSTQEFIMDEFLRLERQIRGSKPGTIPLSYSNDRRASSDD